MDFLPGKKSIIAGIVMIVAGVGMIAGWIPGEKSDGMQMIGTGIGIITLRLGIKKAEK